MEDICKGEPNLLLQYNVKETNFNLIVTSICQKSKDSEKYFEIKIEHRYEATYVAVYTKSEFVDLYV